MGQIITDARSDKYRYIADRASGLRLEHVVISVTTARQFVALQAWV